MKGPCRGCLGILCGIPEKPEAHHLGLFSFDFVQGLGRVACCFGLLGFSGCSDESMGYRLLPSTEREKNRKPELQPCEACPKITPGSVCGTGEGVAMG